MPIRIEEEKQRTQINYLEEDNWNLSVQIEKLYEWVTEFQNNSNSKIIADVAFSSSKNSTGGGAVVDLDMMKLLVEKNVELHLTEYPE